ncbi:unnamed protein product [Sphagnum troendelagicum]|uniref:Secreted protein n=1 Tax=Sphagnum troendelagicum TaxID=128251 RepID=A0ABP0UVF9_9BRYO
MGFCSGLQQQQQHSRLPFLLFFGNGVVVVHSLSSMWRDAIAAVLVCDYWRLDTRVAGASSCSSSRCDYPPEKGEWRHR